ncbi:hypothetical protein HDU96_004953 [Phlyctochytrium bullatum]|nr:hypothetical protein HDU96_004953 [Phlyctochytrium bullatum]
MSASLTSSLTTSSSPSSLLPLSTTRPPTTTTSTSLYTAYPTATAIPDADALPSPLLSLNRGFVKRKGSDLVLVDDPAKPTPTPLPFRFISYNIPTLHWNEDIQPRAVPNAYEQADALRSLAQIGARVTRTYVLGMLPATWRKMIRPPVRHVANVDPRTFSQPGAMVPPGNWTLIPATANQTVPLSINEDLFVGLDRALALADHFGIRIIIPFIDHWHWWGGVTDFAGYYNVTPQQFFSNPACIAGFTALVEYVATRVNTITNRRYRDDPTILGWETGNELGGQGTVTVYPSWTLAIADTLKRVAPNQLVIDGSYNTYNGEWFEEVLRDNRVDMHTGHYYGGTYTQSSYMRIPVAYIVAASVLLVAAIATTLFLIMKRRGTKAVPGESSAKVGLDLFSVAVRPSVELSFIFQDVRQSSPEVIPPISPNPTPTASPQPASTSSKAPILSIRSDLNLPRLLLTAATALLWALFAVMLALAIVNTGRVRESQPAKSYPGRLADDVALVSGQYGKPYFVGEYGLSGASELVAVMDQVVNGSANGARCAGALLWSLRYRSSKGGFYVHSEGGDFWSYHHPGFPVPAPNNSVNQIVGFDVRDSGFAPDERFIVPALANRSLALHDADVPADVRSPHYRAPPSPPPAVLNVFYTNATAPAPTTTLRLPYVSTPLNPATYSEATAPRPSPTPNPEIAGGELAWLVWRGSSGASRYVVEMADPAQAGQRNFTVVAAEVWDNVRDGESAMRLDGGIGWDYRPARTATYSVAGASVVFEVQPKWAVVRVTGEGPFGKSEMSKEEVIAWDVWRKAPHSFNPNAALVARKPQLIPPDAEAKAKAKAKHDARTTSTATDLNLSFIDSFFDLGLPSMPTAVDYLPLLHTPRTTQDDGSMCAWIDKALVEKFYRCTNFVVFEVVPRDLFITNFDDYRPELRSAMACLAAGFSVPPAPVALFHRYYHEARQLLFRAMDEPNLSTLQAAVIVTSLSTVIRKEFASTDRLIRLTMRLLTLFRLDDPATLRSPDLSRTDYDVLTRCFWSCIFHDRLAAAVFGQPAEVSPDCDTTKLFRKYPVPQLPDSKWFLCVELEGSRAFSADTRSTPSDTNATGSGPSASPSPSPAPIPSLPDSSSEEFDTPDLTYLATVSSLLYDASRIPQDYDLDNSYASHGWKALLHLERQLQDFEELLPRRLRYTPRHMSLLTSPTILNPLDLRVLDGLDCAAILAVPVQLRKTGHQSPTWGDSYPLRLYNRFIIQHIRQVCLILPHQRRIAAQWKRIADRVHLDRFARRHRPGFVGVVAASDPPAAPFQPLASRRLAHSLRACIGACHRTFVGLRSIGLPAALSHPDYAVMEKAYDLPMVEMASVMAACCLLHCLLAIGWANVADRMWRRGTTPAAAVMLDLSLADRVGLLRQVLDGLEVMLLVTEGARWLDADGLELAAEKGQWVNVLKAALSRYRGVATMLMEGAGMGLETEEVAKKMEDEEIVFLGGLQCIVQNVAVSEKVYKATAWSF